MCLLKHTKLLLDKNAMGYWMILHRKRYDEDKLEMLVLVDGLYNAR